MNTSTPTLNLNVKQTEEIESFMQKIKIFEKYRKEKFWNLSKLGSTNTALGSISSNTESKHFNDKNFVYPAILFKYMQ